MNPANFASHGGPMRSPVPGGDKVMQQSHQQKADSRQMLLKHIGQALHAQGAFTGWRESVKIQERAVRTLQIVSTIRLLQPHVEIQKAINAALKFEEKIFRESKDKAEYDSEYTMKLAEMRDSRQRRAALQGGMIQNSAAPGGMPQNQGQHMFPGQIPRPTHTSPVAMQQPRPQQPQQPPGMGMLNQQIPMQPQPFPQPGERPPPGRPQDPNPLTANELEQVFRLADQMLQKTPPAEVDRIRMNMNMPPEQKQSFSQRGQDPVVYLFRQRAYAEVRKHKMTRMGMAARTTANNPDPANAMMADPNALHRQASQPGHGMGVQGNAGMQPGMESGFIGNIDHLQTQQVDGLRSQEAGQLVVPATTSQGMNQSQYATQPGVFPGAQQGVSRPGVNPAMLAHQQQALQNAQRDRIQQAAHYQSQSEAQVRAQVAQKAQMAMSSQANPQMPQAVAGQNAPMPPGPRPVGPGQAHPGRTGPPTSAPPGIGQDQAALQQNSRSQIPHGLPLATQSNLAQLSPEQIALLMPNQPRRMVNNQPVPRPNQAPGQTQQSMPDNQTPQMQTAHLMGDPNMRAPMGTPQHIMGMGGMQPPSQNPQPPQFMRKPNQFQSPNDLLRLQQLRQSGNFDMSEDQVREMDRLPFPHTILNANAHTVPSSIKTWGQLKSWANQNPQALGDALPKLMMLQKIHLRSLSAQRENVNRNAAKNGVAQGAFGPNAASQPQFNPQAFQRMNPESKQHPPPNMPFIRPITADDLELARQKFPAQAQNLTDDALRALLEKNRLRNFQRNSQAAQALGHNSANQPQAAPDYATMQNQQFHQVPQTQPRPPNVSQQSTPMTQQTSAPVHKTPVQPAAKNQRAPNAKQPGKGVKRPAPSDEELQGGVSVAPPMQTTVSQPEGNIQAKGRLPPHVAAMSAQQRAQLEAHLRRQQQGPPKQTITKVVADDAWAHLPEHIKRIYAEEVRLDSAVIPVAITQEQKAKMAQQLRDSTDMLGRMDALIKWVARLADQDRTLRMLLQMRMLLMKQFKGPDWTLADQFTIEPGYLTSALAIIRKSFTSMVEGVKAHRPSQPGSQPRTAQRTVEPQATPMSQSGSQGSSVPLNASNLHQLEQQEAAIQRAKRAQPVPPAPTSLQPPFPLGATSPQGIPRAYGPPQVTKENLVLPKPKKRKQNPPSNEPTPKAAHQQTPKSQAQVKTPVNAKKPAPAINTLFKCPIPECPFYVRGFPTQAALDGHVQGNHKPEEPVSNPLDFAIESYRIGLGIDKLEKDQAASGHEPKPTLQQQQQTGKTAGLGKLKQEGGTRPSTPGTAHIGKAVGYTPTKSASASSMQPKPSQMSNGREQAGLKGAADKDDKSGGSAVKTKDPWEDSPISLEMIRSTFGDLGGDNSCGLAPDPLVDILLSETPAKPKSSDTPQSSDTGVNLETPEDRDMDEAAAKMLGLSGDSWIPNHWINLPGDADGGLLINDEPWEQMKLAGPYANDCYADLYSI